MTAVREGTGRRRRVLFGLAMAGLLLVVHVTAWRAARDAFARHVAYPLVAAIDTERAAGFTLDAESFDRTITAVRAGSGEMEVYRSPANMDYLLAALVLIAAFPRRRYWLTVPWRLVLHPDPRSVPISQSRRRCVSPALFCSPASPWPGPLTPRRLRRAPA